MRTTLRNGLRVTVILCVVLSAIEACGFDLSLSIGGAFVPAAWVNDQIAEYGIRYHELIKPIEYALSGRLGLRIPDWSFWRATTRLGLDLRTVSRMTEGGRFSADLLGFSAGADVLLGKLIPAIDVIAYLASYDAPERDVVSLSGWGIGLRLGISYRQSISPNLAVEIGVQGDVARIKLDGDRNGGASDAILDLSGIGASIGMVWRGW